MTSVLDRRPNDKTRLLQDEKREPKRAATPGGWRLEKRHPGCRVYRNLLCQRSFMLKHKEPEGSANKGTFGEETRYQLSHLTGMDSEGT